MAIRFSNTVAADARQNTAKRSSSITPSQATALTAAYASLIALCIYAILWVPPVVPATAPSTVFSEARALAHVAALASDIGERQVSTPGVEAAAEYLVQQLEEIQRHPHFRTDIVFDVVRESASGAVNFNFLGTNVTNIYINLTNIVVRVATPRTHALAETATRRGLDPPKSLLVNAHYDSTMGTAGASDCASCVAIMLELLRALATNAAWELDAPLVVLFNGGEETLMQASHGFMATSVFNQQLGAFINLESTGPRGVPIMFQHTGSWTASVYASSVSTPRGTSMSQDFFESGLIPGDTDYKMFSSRYQGSLPGIDVAFVLGGSMYHTHADSVENIRPGTVQELGNNMMGAVAGFTTELAKRALREGVAPAGNEHSASGGTPSSTAKDDNHDAAYYFDVFWAMVVYPKHTAHLLHNAPLAMLLLAPIQIRCMPGGSAVPLRYGRILRASLGYVVTACVAIALPAIVGAVRAVLSARPLVFFSHHLAGYALHVPLALAALLCGGALVPDHDIPTAAMGASWVWGALGMVATQLHLGAAIYPFLWTAPILLAITASWRSSPAMQLASLLVCSSVATLVAATSGMTLVEHVMDKINLAGGDAGPTGIALGDAAVGGILGLAVVLSAGVLGPTTGAALAAAKRLRRVVVVLLGCALVVAIVSSTLSPYDVTHPKRIFCQHLHTVRGGRVVDSQWVVTTTDPYPPLPAQQSPLSPPHGQLWTFFPGAVTTSNSTKALLPLLVDAVPADAVQKRYLYPLSAMLRGVAVPAPGPPDDLLPAVNVLQKHATRREIELDLGRPCWGLLNISTPALTGWSFTDELTSIAPGQHLVRFAGNGGGERLRFWIDANAPVRIELTAKYFDHDGLVAEFGRQHYGDARWVAYTGLLVYHVDVDIS